MRRRALPEADFPDCFMEEAYEGRRPQGLSWVETELVAFRRIFSSLTYLLICPPALLHPWVVQKLEWNPL